MSHRPVFCEYEGDFPDILFSSENHENNHFQIQKNANLFYFFVIEGVFKTLLHISHSWSW